MEQKKVITNLPSIFSFNYPLGPEDIKWLRAQQISKDKRYKSTVPVRICVSKELDNKWRVQKLKKGDSMPKEGVLYELRVCFF